ncbi:hypothetical protein Tco_0898642 [Tanacetum coccineum]
MAFVSTPSSTNEINTANVQVSTANSLVSTASTHDNTANLSDATVYAFLANQPNGSQLVHKDLEQIHEYDLEEMDFKWQLALLSMRARRYYQRTGKKITINESDTAGYDKSKSYMADEEVPTNLALMAFSDSEFNLATYKRRLASVEEQLVFYKKNKVMFCDQIVVLKRDASFKDSEINALNIQIEKLKKEKESNHIKIKKFKNASKSLDKLIGSQISNNNRKGVGYNVVPPPPTGLFAPPTIDLSNSGLKEFQQPEFEGYGFKANKGVCENSSNEIKKTTDAPIIEDWVSDCDEDDSEVMVLKSDNVQHKPEQANQPKKVSQNLRNNRTKWNEIKTQKLGVGFQFTKKACFVCGSFNHLIKDCDFHDKKMVQKPVLNNVKKGTGQREVRPVWNNAMRVNHQNFSNSRRNFVPTAVLTKSGIVPVSAARPINTAAPKSFVNAAKTRPNAFQKSHSPSRRPFYQQTALKNRNLNDKVNTAKVNSVNTAKGNRVTSAVGEQGINVVKYTACCIWNLKLRQTQVSLELKGSYEVAEEGQTIGSQAKIYHIKEKDSTDEKGSSELMKIEMTREEHERINFEKALELQKQLDEREETDNIDWNTVVEQNMTGYKMGYFKGMSYDEIRPIFKEEYNKIQTLFKKEIEVEKTKTKRIAEETLLQESFKKLRTAEASRSEPIQEQPTE